MAETKSDENVRFSGKTINACMDTEIFGRTLVFRDETESTNNDARAFAENGCKPGLLVVADMQTAGRGRRGREWLAPSGQNIYMTLVLKPECVPDNAAAVTLVMAISVLEAVREIIPDIEGGIKWPNDIVVNNKKICGILTEMCAESGKIRYVLAGVGVNVNQKEFPNEIKETATSLFLESGMETERSRLVSRVMYFFEQNYRLFEKTWDLKLMLDKYNSMLINRGKRVRVLDPKGEYEGIAHGINENGGLIVERQDNGELVYVYAGEVSVRGVYGYAI